VGLLYLLAEQIKNDLLVFGRDGRPSCQLATDIDLRRKYAHHLVSVKGVSVLNMGFEDFLPCCPGAMLPVDVAGGLVAVNSLGTCCYWLLCKTTSENEGDTPSGGEDGARGEVSCRACSRPQRRAVWQRQTTGLRSQAWMTGEGMGTKNVSYR
jgi:hypothetical protein